MTWTSMLPHDPPALTEPRVWAVALPLALGFAGVWLGGQNQALLMLLNGIGPGTGDLVWAHLTILGDTAVALAICLPFWRRRGDLVWALAIGAVVSTLWVHGLKPVMDMDRPLAVLGKAVHVIGPPYKRHSFPSGHATTAFAVAGLYALGLRSRLVFAVAVTLAALAAMSRVVVGVHWPLDVLAGALGGWLSALLGLRLARRAAGFGARPLVQWTMGLAMIGSALALVLGYNTGYETSVFQRILGVVCLASALTTFRQHPRDIDLIH